MSTPFTQRSFGNTGINVTPMGLSASYLPGRHSVHVAADEGINLFFAYGFDVQMIRALKELMKSQRDRFVVVTGAYSRSRWGQDVRKTLEKRLRQFKTDYIDIFLFLGVMKPSQFPPRVQEELFKLKKEGKVRAIGISGHDRKLHGQVAEEGAADALMVRYNAAHRGAERDVFPHTPRHDPGVIGYTATRWTYLLRRPRTLPRGVRVPTAGECYRFVLSHPAVHTVLTAPRNERQLLENIAEVRKGPLSDEEMKYMRDFGDAVYRLKKWFM